GSVTLCCFIRPDRAAVRYAQHAAYDVR
ncbi:hypothetical protein NPIL_326121, partial [Nephila pilipes]